jgi:hypothetical protein
MPGYSLNYEPKQYVKNATDACCQQGCQALDLAALARRLSGQAREALEMLENKEEQVQIQPTQALWCEQGGHSFSEKDPDVQVLTIQGRGPGGEAVTESRTSCGECATAAKTRLGKARNQQVQAVTE